jgi:hypothetical protein
MMSGWLLVSSGWNAKPRNVNSTPAVGAGPAQAARRVAGDKLGGRLGLAG